MHRLASPPAPVPVPVSVPAAPGGPARVAPWPAEAAWPWLLAAAACALSLLRTGYSFDFGNNAFHIPIVLRFAELPQFADDPFVLSLGRFVSPVYPLLSLVATEDNAPALFFAGLACAHLLTFYALLRIGALCGVEGRVEQAAFVFLLVATRGLYWNSPVGADGMLGDAFSHTEVARAVALLALAGLLCGRAVRAGALAGLAFAINAFVGLWTLVPVAVWHALAPMAGAGRAARLRSLLRAGAAFAVPAAPVAVWIAAASAGGAADFDYRAFLLDYYPNHFFLHASSPWQVARLACAVLAGGLAAGLLDRGRGVPLVLASLAGVFVAGVPVGMFVESRLVLNLHLLRVDGMMVMLSAALVAAATVAQVRRGRPVALAAAALACLGLFAGFWPVVAAAMLLAHGPRVWPALDRAPRWPRAPRRVAARATWPVPRRVAFLAGVLVLAGGGSLYAWSLRQVQPAGPPSNRDLVGGDPPVRDWLAVKLWARRATPADAVFLLPPGLDDGFRTGARRRVWVGWKDGATAMWAPWTYHAWRRRREETRGLDGLGPSLAYACAHDITHVVLDLRPRGGIPADPARAVFLNRWFEVHAARCAEPG